MANDSAIVMGVRISKHMDREIGAHAARVGKTKAGIVRDAIEAYEYQSRINAALEAQLNRLMDMTTDAATAASEGRDEVRALFKIITGQMEEK